jgi:hypothetical protein
MVQIDYTEVGKAAYPLGVDHGRNAHMYAARLAQESEAQDKPEEAAFWRAVSAALTPRSR